MSGTVAARLLERLGGMWQIQTVTPALLIGIFAFLFGLVIGSFLNVCIVRIPEGKSIVSPASACPECSAEVRPYDNIPVVSYLVLGGKCRFCKATISWMYPVVESLNALLFLGCYLAFGVTAEALKWAVFSSLLIVLVFTDLRERILPDAVNFTGLGMALALSLFTKPTDGTALLIANHLFAFSPPAPALSFADAILGAAAGSAFLWLVSETYFRLRGREGMGLGDVKMMLMAGAFLGVERTLLTILAGSLLGSVLGIAFILAKRKDSEYELPFGTFLGMAALLVVFFGTPLVEWYQSTLLVR
ncbi:MAG: prepilin peptidase [Candidatus Acidiferrales bacterium]|jgi:leader peptidase (prepilin peptidase)/N-methyltransferase